MTPKNIPTIESEAKPRAKLALNREEAADAISVSLATLDRLTKRCLIKPSWVTRRPVYPVFELERYLKETQRKGPA